MASRGPHRRWTRRAPCNLPASRRRRHRIRALALAGAVVLGSALGHDPVRTEAGETCGIPAVLDAERVEERSLCARIGGQKVGHQRIRLGHMKDGTTVLEKDVHIGLGTPSDERSMRLRIYTLEHFDADDAELAFQILMEKDGTVTETCARYGPAALHFTVRVGEESHEVEMEVPAGHSNERRAFRELLDTYRRGAGNRVEYLAFTGLDEFSRQEMTIKEMTTIVHGDESFEGYVVEHTTAKGGYAVLDASGLPLRIVNGVETWELTDDPPFVETDYGAIPDSELEVEGSFGLDLDLDRLELTMRLAPSAEADAPGPRDAAYQTVTRDGEAYHLILHPVRPGGDAATLGRPVHPDDETVLSYLGATPLCQSDDERIQEQAAQIVRGTTRGLEAVQRIVDWVHDSLAPIPGYGGDYSAVDALERRRGDCKAASALTVALCRAAGIPARQAYGIELVPQSGERSTAGYHAWGEVWLGGWVGVDATIPEVGTSARYILLNLGTKEDTSTIANVLPIVLQRPRLRIDAYRLAGGDRLEAGGGARLPWRTVGPVAAGIVALLLVVAVSARRIHRKRERIDGAEARERLRRSRRAP